MTRARLIVAFSLIAFVLAADEAQAAQLTVSWTDSSNGTARTKLERRTSSTSYVQVADLAAGVRSYVDSTVGPGTTYCYRARAYKSTGVSAYSNEACAITSYEGYQLRLAVLKAGTGAGTVTGYGINCGSVCSASYLSSTTVALVATPATGSRFVGWSGGGCSGTGMCVVGGNTSITVTATFSRL